MDVRSRASERNDRIANLVKSLAHNVGVVMVGLVMALLCRRLDSALGMRGFHALAATAAGWLLVVLGFALRVWAAFLFYEHRMRVISLVPQGALLTTGPYRFSRNPLYLGGNVFVFFGAGLLVGSPSAIILTACHLPLVDLFIRREERQLHETFGAEWLRYRRRVRRWL